MQYYGINNYFEHMNPARCKIWSGLPDIFEKTPLKKYYIRYLYSWEWGLILTEMAEQQKNIERVWRAKKWDSRLYVSHYLN